MVLKSPDQKQYWSQGIEFEMITHIINQGNKTLPCL